MYDVHQVDAGRGDYARQWIGSLQSGPITIKVNILIMLIADLDRKIRLHAWSTKLLLRLYSCFVFCYIRSYCSIACIAIL